MSINARVVADSISPGGRRVTTMVMTYNRYIHDQFMTHRAFSRNAASSRAIPSKKIRRNVRLDPAYPVFYGMNQSGMQAEVELTGWRKELGKFIIFGVLMHMALLANWLLEKLKWHKQIANRYLEPWFNITVVVTATDWSNWFALRTDKHAQPEIRALADAMLHAMNESIPELLQPGQWHLPFVMPSELEELGYEQAIKVSVARCARVSYMNHEGKRSTLEEDLKLYERLVIQKPLHASPAEHQCTPLGDINARSGNLRGWAQHRKFLPDENVEQFSGLLIQ